MPLSFPFRFVPLCIQEKDITAGQLMTCENVEEFMNTHNWAHLPTPGSLEYVDPSVVTCHEVCATIAKEFPYLVHYKGTFSGLDHSWLMFRDNEKVILDPYPWACASGPILVTIEGSSPWRRLYAGKPVSSLK